MKHLILVLCTVISSAALGGRTIQSQFQGPIEIKVWEHWQPSWNVEYEEGRQHDFMLLRGFEDTDTGPEAFLALVYTRVAKEGLRVVFNGEAQFRDGDFGTAVRKLDTVEVLSQMPQLPMGTSLGISSFQTRVPKKGYVDEAGETITRKIHFAIFDGDTQIYEASVVPMYVRGPASHHWSAPTDPYMAYGGKGSIKVTKNASLDSWDGIPLNLIVDIAETNEIKKDSVLGLHRHEFNQERYQVREGRMQVQHGIATRSSGDYTVTRQWDSKGEMRAVSQFDASGGYIEYRELGPGEYHVIIPDGHRDNACFHGLLALTDGKFDAEGRQN